MFAAMPYENSLVVMEMNGPQLKQVLERAYRNYYFYKYVPGYGGYSYYTTCMLDTDKGNEIVYRDANPTPPSGDNVAGLLIGGTPVDFTDATTYYRVSTVNYLAAGACNFSDAGATLWPLNQIVADTQYYVRDAVIEHVQAQTAPISPAIEGRIAFAGPERPTVATPTVAPEPSLKAQPAVVSATFTASDAYGAPTCTIDHGDGTGPVHGFIDGGTCTGAPHTFSEIGVYTVSVTVRDGLAQTATATASHDVNYVFSGLMVPGERTTIKAGSTLPVFFSLDGDQGMDVIVSAMWQSGTNRRVTATASSSTTRTRCSTSTSGRRRPA